MSGATGSGETQVAAIGLGSNVGDRRATIGRAIELLRQTPRIDVVRVSEFIETDPLPTPDTVDRGGPYLNAAALIETTLSARELLASMLRVEEGLGRDRSRGVRWAARTIDLDLLLFGDRVIDAENLKVPHPEMLRRSFVLGPLAQIAPDRMIPGVGLTVAGALDALRRDPAALGGGAER